MIFLICIFLVVRNPKHIILYNKYSYYFATALSINEINEVDCYKCGRFVDKFHVACVMRS